MSKIICEVCGSSYPDTAAQCPICGCANTAGAKTAAANSESHNTGSTKTKAPVKGGRYSKANVRKRNQAAGNYTSKNPAPKGNPDNRGRSNRGLLIAAVILLLAIIAVLSYIAIRFLLPKSAEPDQPVSTTVSTQPDVTTGGVLEDLSCTKLAMSEKQIKLDVVGQAYLLNVKTVPANTTDLLVYESSNPKVATVTEEGLVQAVSNGNAVITITCGKVKMTRPVVCTIAEESTVPETTASVTEPINANEKLELNREDVTFSYRGEKWQVYSGKLGKSQITWKSEDESVVTVKNGVVEAVGIGTANVYAEYKGQKVSCIFRCSWAADTDPTSAGNDSEEGGFGGNVSEDNGAVG